MESGFEFVREVLVDRRRDPTEVLSATGCKLWVDSSTVNEMPGGGDKIEKVEVGFFSLDHGVDEEGLKEKYGIHKSIPADPYVLSACHEEDTSLLINYRTGTHWRNEKGVWCICRFEVGKFKKERKVDVGPRFPYRIWERGWYFAGIRI